MTANDVLTRLFNVSPFYRAPWRRHLVALAIMTALAVGLVPAPAAAKRTLIRDAEIETIIRSFAVPLFQAAGLAPDAVRIRLVQDNTLNAFVQGGQNIYLHTGLILQSGNLNALIGVIAHETGHIEGGHLVRMRATLEEASTIQMIGTILGTAAAVATGRSDVGHAVVLGGQAAGARTFFKFSRTQESAADQAAMRLLDATGRSGRGLEDFLGTLEGQEVLTDRLQDPYARTHPMSRERLEAMKRHNASSPYADVPVPKDQQLLYERMVAKLYGFIHPLRSVLRRYPETDQSFAARYARAIAYFRAPEIERALKLMDGLIAEKPRDPFLYEMKGQMLFEHARAEEALAAYREAYRLAPHQPLIAMELAHVELEIGTPDLLHSAIEHFRATTQMNEGSAFVWRQLGIAYGRLGDLGMSDLALAESEARRGQLANAEFHATRASKTLPKGSGAHLQALDILEAIKSARAAKALK